ncbi:alkyl sulfatase dimerization domain-containing protein [Variovorax dokdonensis]|uniref:Alkyl sulfatase dimerization domain-containing protein n=1 Tax=Variovorax dokdonensis TaxID=344883 RepID=A0ABT7NGN7_9BURK|nr:alkyl sulfatase dimerization domain-containing protein [Variovorax dokdonensis]MDM0047104.1 alkyl sulfatase dimerization domain-containing protein [Variovorax dokdonensis]
MNASDMLMMKQGLVEQADGVYTVGGQGNSLVVDLGESLLLVDAGPGGAVTQRMIAQVRAGIDKPVSHIVYSHGHMGYNNGVAQWLEAAQAQGEALPRIVAHERVPHRYRRYRETAGLQAWTNSRQFRTPYPAEPPAHWFRMPDQTYASRLVIPGSRNCVELLHAPSETDDGTAVWVPGVRALYGSCAFIKTCPNAGSPLRIQRDVVRWAGTLDMFRALRPHLLIPEFGKPLDDMGEIDGALRVTADALRWLRREVVERMNQGIGELDILHDLALPEALFAHPCMKPVYGCVDYIVRDIWRSENGWWNRNPTDLHPAAPAAAAQAVFDAIPDRQRVLTHARQLQRNGQTQLALHVVDLLALCETADDDPLLIQARELKAQLCRERALQVSSMVSRNLYLSAADELVGRAIGDDEVQQQEPQWA